MKHKEVFKIPHPDENNTTITLINLNCFRCNESINRTHYEISQLKGFVACDWCNEMIYI